MSISTYISQFLDNLRADGKSQATVSSYASTLTRFADQIGAENPVGTIRTQDISAFKASLGAVKPTTLWLRLEHLKLFFDWLHAIEAVQTNPVKAALFPNKKNVAQVRNRPISEKLLPDEALSVISAVRPAHYAEKTFIRDKAIAVLIITCGMRNSELADLTPADLDFAGNSIAINHGKGNKFRNVPFPLPAQKIVKDYMRCGYRPAGMTDADYLFGTTPDGEIWNRLDRHILSEIVRRFIEAVTGKDKIRSHKLRHAFASVSREMGMTKEDIQECLGHASLDTTERYLDRLDPEAAPRRMNDAWNQFTGAAV